MIVDNIIYFGNQFLQFVIGLLPDASPTYVAQISTTITDFKTLMNIYDFIFPVGTFFTVLSLIILIESGYTTFRLSLFIAKYITGRG